MSECCSRPAGATGPIRSPHFVRVAWTWGCNLPDINRKTLKEAAKVFVETLEVFREAGFDHAPGIKSLEAGDHRDGALRPITLTDLYRLAGVARQTVLGEFSPSLTLSSAGRRGALHLLSSP